MNFLTGQILAFDKPLGLTSFQLVAKVRWLLTQAMGGTKLKVGHAGTLDPLASGVMIVCTGRATKKIDALQAGVKEYVATLRLGATTPSFDLEHPIDATYPTAHIDRALVETTLKGFVGDIMQVPPAYSACKIGGRRAYEMARNGEEVRTARCFARRRRPLPHPAHRLLERHLHPRLGSRHRAGPGQRRAPHRPAPHASGRCARGKLPPPRRLRTVARTANDRNRNTSIEIPKPRSCCPRAPAERAAIA